MKQEIQSWLLFFDFFFLDLHFLLHNFFSHFFEQYIEFFFPIFYFFSSSSFTKALVLPSLKLCKNSIASSPVMYLNSS